MRPIDADAIPYTMLYKENWLKGTGVEKPGVWKDTIDAMPTIAQPEIIRCRNCKHWKDSDGVYRRGIDAESKCPLNIQEVYAGTFYCGYAERRDE